MTWFALFFLITLFGLWLIFSPILQNWKRRRLQREPLPTEWQRLLAQRWPLYRRLPQSLQYQLHSHIQVFLAEKNFIGCNGLEINTQMRLFVAAQACLLLLNRHTDYYPGLTAILLYPDAFWVEHDTPDEYGIHANQRHILSGESWEQGKVILSWHDAETGLDASEDEAFNVVLHEFAHQLDGENGAVNGAPALPRRKDYARWAKIMDDAYTRHCAAKHYPSGGLSAYAGESPAEFFAVATEAFFMLPHHLRHSYPSVYDALSEYYQLNPVDW
jgi:Mlc titration factor MtfA (ptsG expression regulator)